MLQKVEMGAMTDAKTNTVLQGNCFSWNKENV